MNNRNVTQRRLHTHTFPPLIHEQIHTHTVLEMAHSSWGTQLGTITLPEMNHLLLISAHSPPQAYSSQLNSESSFISSHFHKNPLIDPQTALDLDVFLFNVKAVAGLVSQLFTV